jgi:MFS family permease
MARCSSPAAGRLWPLRDAVPFRQRAASAAGRAETRRRISQGGDGDDVGLHHRRTGGDTAIAILVGRKADVWGRKPLFLAGFAILPIRAVLYTVSDDSVWLIGVQVLDGVGAGIFGALTPQVIADVMRGTGRYNLAQGAIATMVGIGTSLSGLAAGEVVDHLGYSAAFLTLGAVALAAAITFAVAMPRNCRQDGLARARRAARCITCLKLLKACSSGCNRC